METLPATGSPTLAPQRHGTVRQALDFSPTVQADRSAQDAARLQAWWFYRQGLMEPQPGLTSQQVLARTGWARSVGGANPYLCLFARAGISREQVEREMETQEIHEL